MIRLQKSERSKLGRTLLDIRQNSVASPRAHNKISNIDTEVRSEEYIRNSITYQCPPDLIKKVTEV